jgi:L-seryl-tRNA(Ser) seleniumtransferase
MTADRPDPLRAELLRALPSVTEVFERPGVAGLVDLHGRPVVLHAVRAVLERARQAALTGEPPPPVDALAEMYTGEAIAAEVAGRLRPGLRRVINASGVVLHTNLGRAPMAPEAVAAVASAGGGYVALEIDLASGGRGRREGWAADLICELLECEAATVVNNGAAAVLLVLQALAAGREVPVSRGELVEIGGGFRVPDVMTSSGCRLVEVGTTNRTRLSDFARVAGPATAGLLKVHRSNFDVVGFTENVSVRELSGLAKKLEIPLIHDLGSGLLSTTLVEGLLVGETTPKMSLTEGADVVCFSGDKLLGGPQAGIIAGRAEIVEAVARHPMMRALRCDKLTLAALEATLRLYRDGRADDVPVVAMLRATVPDLAARAEVVCRHLARVRVGARVIEVMDTVGGGSAPRASIPGIAVELEHARPERLAARLRNGDPAVVSVLRDGRLRLHLRTVGAYEVDAMSAAVARACG